jgi:hypothetical protein
MRLTARAKDRVVAVGIAVVVAVVVGATAQSLGFVRDEGYYFKAGTQYAEWFRLLATAPSTALSTASIDKHLSYNPEHPFLLKGLYGLSWLVNDVVGRPFAQHNALRFPAWLVAGASAMFVFLLARQLLHRRAAVVATALFVAQPHVFWHMHVACFDVGVVGAHAALVWAYLRFRHTLGGAVLVGVVFGIAGAVKHNVLPMPALLVLHWWVCELRWRPASRLPTAATAATHPATNAATSTATLVPGALRIPIVFFTLAIVAPVVYVFLWPYLWPDPATRWGQYIAFHLQHEHYPILYFGDLLTAPPFPWLFPIVMSALTIPLPILALIGVGVVVAVVNVVVFVAARVGADVDVEVTRVPLGHDGQSSGSHAFLLLANAALPVALIALPSTPIFGGTKHWMNALPFLCVLGAWALEEGAARLAEARRAVVVVVVAVAAAAPGVAISARVWPYGLGSYNELAGFVRGAATVGMQRTFWGYETRGALPLINATTPQGGRIHFGDVNADSHRMYVADGLLRRDIAFSNTVRGAAVAHVEPQGEFKQQQLDVWNEWGRRLDVVVDVDGVPVSTVTFR